MMMLIVMRMRMAAMRMRMAVTRMRIKPDPGRQRIVTRMDGDWWNGDGDMTTEGEQRQQRQWLWG
jgi:hypothetical protein